MNIHWLQHVPFEGLGCIEPWLTENGHAVSCTRLWAGDSFPSSGKNEQALTQSVPMFGNVDGLIVMGGPMSVADEGFFPWLVAEKAFITEIIAEDKPVLGICLGAQLIAEVLGAKVWPVRRSLGEGGKNEHKEIGFFPMSGKKVSNVWNFPEEFLAFHWHGDTFDVPDGAEPLASSEACENQAFVYNDKVLALQFHLETTEESLLALYENCSDEIEEGPFFQTLEEMKKNFPTLANCNALMKTLLQRLF